MLAFIGVWVVASYLLGRLLGKFVGAGERIAHNRKDAELYFRIEKAQMAHDNVVEPLVPILCNKSELYEFDKVIQASK